MGWDQRLYLPSEQEHKLWTECLLKSEWKNSFVIKAFISFKPLLLYEPWNFMDRLPVNCIEKLLRQIVMSKFLSNACIWFKLPVISSPSRSNRLHRRIWTHQARPLAVASSNGQWRRWYIHDVIESTFRNEPEVITDTSRCFQRAWLGFLFLV